MLSEGDVAKLLKFSRTLWHNFKVDDDDLELTIETWRDMFEPWTYDDVAAALKGLKGDFMPSLPSLRTALEHRHDPTEDEAYRMARDWWRYLEQRQYNNGSGYAPRMPVDVPVSVQRVVEALGGSEANLERFRVAWRDR